jgi:hypothetical protein
MMPGTTITFRVDDAERDELIARAEREKISISDYIRVRLGLRAQGSHGGELDVDPRDAQSLLREQIVDHERRLHALEQDSARRHEQPRRPD